MKKRNIVLLACLMLFVFMSVSVQAADSRALVVPCPSCATGELSTTVSRKYEHDEAFPCEHGKQGYDYYKVYNVTTKRICRTCGYSNQTVVEEHVFSYCSGY